MPVFDADNDDFTLTLYNLNYGTNYATQVNENDTQGGTQDDTQGDTQDVPQGGTQGDDLDKWIEYQVAVYPKITTAELAQQSGKSIITIKRRIAKMPHIVYIGSGYSGHWEVRKKERL